MDIVPTAALLAAIDRAEARSWERGVRAAEHATGTAETHILSVSDARAFTTPQTPVGMFNRVLAFTDAQADHIPTILSFFERHSAIPRFDICPLQASVIVTHALSQRGLLAARGAFHQRRLFAKPEAVAVASDVEVRPMSESSLDAWLSVDEAVWPGPRGDRRSKLMATLHAPRFHRFLAYIDDRPVALGRLEIDGDLAILNGAGTLPDFRGRGCQRALIGARAQVARAQGCKIITSLVTPGSQSEHNLHRAGITNHADRQVWSL